MGVCVLLIYRYGCKYTPPLLHSIQDPRNESINSTFLLDNLHSSIILNPDDRTENSGFLLTYIRACGNRGKKCIMNVGICKADTHDNCLGDLRRLSIYAYYLNTRKLNRRVVSLIVWLDPHSYGGMIHEKGSRNEPPHFETGRCYQES